MKTTCQICERQIEANKGIIAHHGYTRPEQGWQTNSCMGARQLPYEKSRDLIPIVIVKIDKFIGDTIGTIRKIEVENLPVPFIRTTIKSDNPTYKVRQKEYTSSLNYKIILARRDRERLQKRYDTWKLIGVSQ